MSESEPLAVRVFRQEPGESTGGDYVEAMVVDSDGVAVAEVVEPAEEEFVAAESTPSTADTPVPSRSMRSWVGRCFWAVGSGIEYVFGIVSLIVGLAVLAAVPIVQLLSLGYLLEASGRVARTGRIREALIGVRTAARLGSVALGAWLVLLPVRLAAETRDAAMLLDPEGPAAARWGIFTLVLTVLAVAHITGACFRGGRIRHFFLPVVNPKRMWRAVRRSGALYAGARDTVWEFTTGLRLPYYFWLGLRGFIGALVWLVIPVTLLALGRQNAAVGVLGALLMFVVVLHLPILQTRFATENRLRAMFEFRRARDAFRRAPVALWMAMFFLVLLGLPLYFLKVEMIPREAAWLPSLLFVTFMFPARVMAGWAYGRSQRRETPRHWFFRWSARLAIVPVAVVYLGVLYLSQFTAWYGVWSLYEQHAFLVPVPFLGM